MKPILYVLTLSLLAVTADARPGKIIGTPPPAAKPAPPAAKPIVAPKPQPAPTSSPAPAPAVYDKEFEGLLNGRFDIHLSFHVEGEKLQGEYFFERQSAYLPIVFDLAGSLAADGTATLREYKDGDETKKPTGTFVLRSLAPDSGLKLRGTWSAAGGGKTQPVTLTETPTSLGGGLVLISGKFGKAHPHENYTTSARYPQIDGSTDPKIVRYNALIHDLVLTHLKTYIKESDQAAAELDPISPTTGKPVDQPQGYDDIDYQVLFSSPRLLSVQFSEQLFPPGGAAHPVTVSFSVTYDLKAGRPLALSDLFQPGSKYLDALSMASITALKNAQVGDSDWLARGAGPQSRNFQNWTLTPYGLRLWFDQYQVASYAEGPKEVILPYKSLRRLLRPEYLKP